jgi:hypothetical protein
MPTRAYVSTLCALLFLLLPLPCFAQAADAGEAKSDDCGVSFETAQRLQTQGKLVDAQAKLIECSQARCPAFLVRECVALYDRLSTSIPTITLVARDETGAPLTDVAVSMDGKVLAEQIGGRAFAVDPGMHEFTFTREGKVVNVRALLSEGEKNKPVIAEFVLNENKATAPPPDAGAAPAAKKKGGPPTATFILGGIGIAGLATGLAYRLIAADSYNELLDTCSPNCSSGKVASVRTEYVVSTVAFGVGGAALVGAGLIWALSGGSESSQDQQALTFTPIVSRHGALAVVEGRL